MPGVCGTRERTCTAVMLQSTTRLRTILDRLKLRSSPATWGGVPVGGEEERRTIHVELAARGG